MSSYECIERAGDAAAYVLGALEPQEAVAFLRHVESCIVCRDELQEFGQVVDVLALAPGQYEAPRRLRRSVLKEVAASAATRTRQRRRSSDRRMSRLVPRLHLTGGLNGGLTAGVAALALAVTGVAVLGGSGSAVNRTIAAHVIGVPGTASLRVSGPHADLIVDHLPQPAPGKIYELWTERAHGTPQPTKSLFSVTTAGATVVEIPGGIRSIARVLVTQEPDGGSLRPTSAPIIVAPVT